MSAEATVIQINNPSTTIVNNNYSTVITASTAIANMPVYVNLSNDTPEELTNTGSAGTSVLASRADHSHPLTGATFNGGNF